MTLDGLRAQCPYRGQREVEFNTATDPFSEMTYGGDIALPLVKLTADSVKSKFLHPRFLKEPYLGFLLPDEVTLDAYVYYKVWKGAAIKVAGDSGLIMGISPYPFIVTQACRINQNCPLFMKSCRPLVTTRFLSDSVINSYLIPALGSGSNINQ